MFSILSNLVTTIVANSGFIAAIIALFSFLYTSKRQRDIEKDNLYQQLEFASAENILAQMRREFVHYILTGSCDVFEILLSGELIGFTILELNKKAKAAIIQDIMIKKNYQGKGIGKEALQKIEEYLKDKNISIILLESGVKNEEAHHFFEKNGYAKISVEYSKSIRQKQDTDT